MQSMTGSFLNLRALSSIKGFCKPSHRLVQTAAQSPGGAGPSGPKSQRQALYTTPCSAHVPGAYSTDHPSSMRDSDSAMSMSTLSSESRSNSGEKDRQLEGERPPVPSSCVPRAAGKPSVGFANGVSSHYANGTATPPNRPLNRFKRSYGSLADLSKVGQDTGVSFVKRVISECFMLVQLAFKLLGYLGIGWKWSFNLSRLIAYATLLLPGFMQIVFYYFFSKRVIRSVPYGKKPRQRLDLYYPVDLDRTQQYPVVIFITGGAWTIGYKAWGALLAKRLSDSGIVVACLDYRNFPQGSAMQMLEDVNTGVQWVCQRINQHYGDPDNITMCGQSAGGQLGFLTLMRQAEQAATGKDTAGAFPGWSPRDIRGFVGVSGAYDMHALAEHFHKRGLYKDMFEKIMSIDGKPAMTQLSPLATARDLPKISGAAQHMPGVVLVHGTSDKSVPYEGTVLMYEALKAAGIPCTMRLFEGKTHTSFLIEDPMCGGQDLLMEAVLDVVKRMNTKGAVVDEGKHSVAITYQTLCPRFLCEMASWVCPF